MFKKFYPYEHIDSVFSIDYEALYEKGYRGIIFDLDNTLVHHGDNSNEKVDNLFKHIHSVGFKTILLTNNDEDRVKRFIKNIDTEYVCDADKPDPLCYLKVLESLGLKKDEVVYMGDQIFIDILGANKSGIASILIDFIRVDSEKRIGKKRYIEKFILLFYKNSKYNHRIGNICKENSNGEKVVL